MANPIQLSVVIITFNEERNIARCVDAVKGIADEIVVLDSFSTDATASICKERGVRFFQHAFDGHIEQKNRALSYASFPYVLSLDADEAPDAELLKAIELVKSNWDVDGYEMNRLTNYCGKWIHHCGWYPDTKLRLWNREKGKWGGINPHDKFEMTNSNSPIKHLPGNILHYSYYSIEEHYRQAEKFSGIAAKALFDRGKTSNPIHAFLKACAKFFRNYFLKLGFLDGKYGFIICKITAHETRMKYSKLSQLHKTGKR